MRSPGVNNFFTSHILSIFFWIVYMENCVARILYWRLLLQVLLRVYWWRCVRCVRCAVRLLVEISYCETIGGDILLWNYWRYLVVRLLIETSWCETVGGDILLWDCWRSFDVRLLVEFSFCESVNSFLWSPCIESLVVNPLLSTPGCEPFVLSHLLRPP